MSSGTRDPLERARHLMMAALDDEWSAEERAELERLLAEHAELREEWNKMRRIKEVTGAMGYSKPPEEVWDGYWGSVYNRVERSLGWVLSSAGALVLSGYGLWKWFEVLLEESDVPLFLRAALVALALGGLVLLVSVVREKLFTRSRDPYREVRR